MPIDVDALVRIKGAVDSVIVADKSFAGASALAAAAETYRNQIRALLADEPALLSEFDGVASPRIRGMLSAGLHDAGAGHRLALSGMGSWLAGLLASANALARQEANAGETVMAERAVGLRQDA